MGKASTSGSAERTRYNEDNWDRKDSSVNEDRAGSRRAVFDSPESQSILKSLTSQAAKENPYEEEAAQGFRTAGATSGGVNPAVDEMIRTNNSAADRMFSNRLASTRAGAYRGGTGANMYAQDRLGADFTNQQANQNANLRYNAFNDGQDRMLQGQTVGATGLAGLSNSRQINSGQLLAMLRGEDSQDAVRQQAQAIGTGGKSGKSSTTAMTAEGRIGY